MIRTQIFPCRLPKTEADALNRESGRIYSKTVTWHYRVYRHTDHWLTQGAAEKLGDYLFGYDFARPRSGRRTTGVLQSVQDSQG